MFLSRESMLAELAPEYDVKRCPGKFFAELNVACQTPNESSFYCFSSLAFSEPIPGMGHFRSKLEDEARQHLSTSKEAENKPNSSKVQHTTSEKRVFVTIFIFITVDSSFYTAVCNEEVMVKL